MVFTFVNPAVAVVAGVLVLGEPLTPFIIGGFALIMTGSLRANVVRPRSRRPAPVTPATGPGQVR